MVNVVKKLVYYDYCYLWLVLTCMQPCIPVTYSCMKNVGQHLVLLPFETHL